MQSHVGRYNFWMPTKEEGAPVSAGFHMEFSLKFRPTG